MIKGNMISNIILNIISNYYYWLMGLKEAGRVESNKESKEEEN
jgi:hypothetical protein